MNRDKSTDKPVDSTSEDDQLKLERAAYLIFLANQFSQQGKRADLFNSIAGVSVSDVCLRSPSASWAGSPLLVGPSDLFRSQLDVTTAIENLLAARDALREERGLGKTLFYTESSALPASKATAESADKAQEGGPTIEDDPSRLALLAAAAGGTGNAWNHLQRLDAALWSDAIALLGGEAVLGRPIPNEETLVEALAAGLPVDVIGALRQAGYAPAVVEQVVAPRRTLRRRKAEQQRLSRGESDAVWRLAHVLALATRVFSGRKAALAWLTRPKPGLGSRTPIDLVETSVGTAYVERILRGLDWGDVA